MTCEVGAVLSALYRWRGRSQIIEHPMAKSKEKEVLGLCQSIWLRAFGIGLYITRVSEEMPAWQSEDGSYLQAYK